MPPPSNSGVAQYPGFGGQPPAPPQFTPPQMPGQQMPAGPPPAKGSRRNILFIVLGTVAIVGVAAAIYFMTNGSDDKKDDKAKNSGTTAATTSAATPEQTASSFPDNSYTSSASSSASSSATPAAPPSSAAAPGGANLDKDSTDKTPFTQAGMVSTTFTDSKKVVYTLKAAGPKPCDKVGDAVVEPIVKSAKCTEFMAASWTDPDNRIIVSAMIIPYPDAATAQKVYQKLSAAHTGDYNQWCPPAGQPGADACTKLAKAGNVTREGKFGNFHRYLLITTAVYADLRNDDSQKDWLNAAADGAFQNTLPGQ
ncbi:hypothetical protein [Catenulispora subtropica]|uniref:Uncharacterized protein n=1 Tax=Catenulispora subtropica TaxID=450798 RepID=A0ABP5BTY4_9ACTN